MSLDFSKYFHLAANIAPVLIWISATDKRCVWFNQVWLDFTGRTMNQEIGNGWAEGVHPDDLAKCLDIYSSHFDAREPFSMEYRLKHHSGKYRWLLDNGKPMFAENGEFEGYAGSCTDITDLKKGEQRLNEIIDLIPVNLFIKDNQSRIILMNKACEEEWGCTFSELQNTTGSRYFPPEQMNSFLEIFVHDKKLTR